MKKYPKFIREYEGDIPKDFILEKYSEVKEEFKKRSYNTQSLQKNYFPQFLESNTLEGDLLTRCLEIRQLGSALTLKKLQLIYGDVLGKSKWDSYCEKQSISNSFEYKKEKYGWSREQFNDYNKSRQVTLQNLVKRHGKSKGERIFKNYCEKQQYTNTLPYFIEKYGEEDGVKEYNRVCSEKAITLENMIRVHGKEKGHRVFYNFKTSINKSTVSNISQKFFEELEQLIEIENSIYFKKCNKEFVIYCENNKRQYLYDYYGKYNGKRFIIEFHGDIWHANPSIYSQNDIPFQFIGEHQPTAKEIWEKDIQKEKCVLKREYQMLIVWESEYLNDKTKTLKSILNEIKRL